MGQLQEARFEEMATWIADQDLGRTFTSLQNKFQTLERIDKHGDPTGPSAFTRIGTRPLVNWAVAAGWKNFSFQDFQSAGYGWSKAVVAITRLLDKGRISRAEAGAYMVQAFPGEATATGSFKNFLEDTFGNVKAEVSELAPEDPIRQEIESDEVALARDRGTHGATQSYDPFGKAILQTNIQVSRLSEEYDAREMTRALHSIAQQVGTALGSISQGNVAFPMGSIHGDSIAPGTIGPSRVRVRDFEELTRGFPGPKDAVILEAAEDADDDNDAHDSAGGMKRVWKTTRFTPPAFWQPTAGAPMRYRVIAKNMKFGVMSFVGNQPDGSTRWRRFTYGLVLKGIPHWFGRRPERILWCSVPGYQPSTVEGLYVGDTGPGSPVGPNSVQYTGTGAGGTTLFNNSGLTTGRDSDNWVDNPPKWLIPTGSDPVLAPNTSDLKNMGGVRFMLITGRDSTEVYSQLNSKRANSAYIGGNAVGPVASCPDGLYLGSVAPAAVSAFDAGTPPRFIGYARNGNNFSNNDSASPLCIGMPFSYDTCQGLRATLRTFSLAIVLDVIHEDTSITEFSVGNCRDNGFRVSETPEIDLNLDLMVV